MAYQRPSYLAMVHNMYLVSLKHFHMIGVSLMSLKAHTTPKVMEPLGELKKDQSRGKSSEKGKTSLLWIHVSTSSIKSKFRDWKKIVQYKSLDRQWCGIKKSYTNIHTVGCSSTIRHAGVTMVHNASVVLRLLGDEGVYLIQLVNRWRLSRSYGQDPSHQTLRCLVKHRW